MTTHPFSELAPEYARRLASARTTRSAEVDAVAHRLTRDANLDHYRPVSDKLGIPVVWMAASFERESASDFTRNPAQGDHWDRVSTHVPRGQGPFSSWKESAINAYRTDHVDVLAPGVTTWSMAYACWKWEIFNGFGPRAHGRASGYLWSGTDQYDPPRGSGGKYVSDGVWSPTTVDKQLGCVAVALRMILIRPELAVGDLPTVAAPELVPVAPVPIGVGGGDHDAAWVQGAMNRLHVGGAPLSVDNNYGRRTRAVVREYQRSRGLVDDGLAGPHTLATIELDLKGSS